MEQNLFLQMRIETERLTIRPFTMADLKAFQGIVSQEDVMKFLPEDVMSLEELRPILTWLVDCYERNTPEKIIKFTVAIVLRGEGELVGWCGLGPVDFDESKITVSGSHGIDMTMDYLLDMDIAKSDLGEGVAGRRLQAGQDAGRRPHAPRRRARR